MIGVIYHEDQRLVVEEFFELFKVPWEPYRDHVFYDVILCTGGGPVPPGGKLIILSGPEKYETGAGTPDINRTLSGTHLVRGGDSVFPVYEGLGVFSGSGTALLKTENGDRTAVRWQDESGRNIIRAGYDLFREVGVLLDRGQPADLAGYPTLDTHISILRSWILDSGMPIVEIPPYPSGYAFIAGLTHDVDFLGIRAHRLDKTVLGFALRCLRPPLSAGLPIGKLLMRWIRNLTALFSLPLVHTGIVKDFWDQLGSYGDLEMGLPATFFFIPFKGVSGTKKPDTMVLQVPLDRRACKYDIRRWKEAISTLKKRGCEIGVHGLDAWCDPDRGTEEKKAVETATGVLVNGIRMHWLFFSTDTPGVLREAGFKYDSTTGYNETVGFWSGTSQIHGFPGKGPLLEVPMQIQDGAMLYPRRMGLSEDKAMQAVKRIIKSVQSHGGILTINWHQRSLGPERQWSELYSGIIRILQEKNVWFATLSDAVEWFETRRKVAFRYNEKTREVALEPLQPGITRGKPMAVRVFHGREKTGGKQLPVCGKDAPFRDIAWTGEQEMLLKI